jgi:hypothetical protein
MTQIQFPQYLRLPAISISTEYTQNLATKVREYTAGLAGEKLDDFQTSAARAKEITPLVLSIIVSIPAALVLSPFVFMASIILPSWITLGAVLTIGVVAHDIFDHIWDHLETDHTALLETKNLFSKRFTMLYFETSRLANECKDTVVTLGKKAQEAFAQLSS